MIRPSLLRLVSTHHHGSVCSAPQRLPVPGRSSHR